MNHPTLFCPECQRYLGASGVCVLCGWQRPLAARLPEPRQPVWRLATGAVPAGQPLLSGESLFCADEAGNLYAVRATSGELLARQEGTGRLRTTLLARGERVYAVSRSGVLLGVDFPPGGDPVEAWHLAIPGTPSRLAGDEHLLYLGNSDGTLFALRDAGEGCEVAWQITLDQSISVAPVPWRHLLLVATRHHHGQVIAIETRGRQEAWRQPLNGRGTHLLLARRGAGTQAGSLLLAVTDQGRLSAFSLPEGDPLGWSFEVEGGMVASPVVDGQTAYLGGGGGEVTALNLITGETRSLCMLDDCVIGLTVWRDLIFASLQTGSLVAMDTTDGEEIWHWSVPGGLAPRSNLVVADGLVLAGSATQGWLALPWHLGKYGWAAQHCRTWGDPEGAAVFSALAGETNAADADWCEANQPEKAAEMWAAIGEDNCAAQAFGRAAQKNRTTFPALAAVYFHRAADHFEAADKPQEASECRRLAGRMGRFPHLKIEVLNHSLHEAGEAGTMAVVVRNIGNSPAAEVMFRIGGNLACLGRWELQQPLLPGSQAELEFRDLIPIAVGRTPLRLLVTYQDGSGNLQRTESSLELVISAPPPGTITVEKDGVVWVSVPKDAPLPNVRVRGDGFVIYKVTEEPREQVQPGFAWPEPRPGFASDDHLLIQQILVEKDAYTIPPGHWAFFFADDRMLGKFEPGRHTRQAVPVLRPGKLPGTHCPDWQVVQFRSGEIRLAFRLGPFPARGLPQAGMDLGLTIAFEPEKAFDLWQKAAQGKETMTASDLQLWLAPELSGVASLWISQRTHPELAAGFAQRDSFALALEEELKDTFARLGLRLVGRPWLLDFILPPI